LNYDPITTLNKILPHLGISTPQVIYRLQRARRLFVSTIRRKDDTTTQRLMELQGFPAAGR
jgi:hypothetical protein